MATKLPNLLPNHSAFAEWAKDSAMLYDCSSIYTQTNQLNTIHMVPDKETAIKGLHELYTNKDLRKTIGNAGFELVNRSEYRWENIARKFYDAMNGDIDNGTHGESSEVTDEEARSDSIE